MKITTSEMAGCRKGPADWFTGDVWLDSVIGGEGPARLKATRVTFAPGARTAWHTHPLGQALWVVSGVGWVQKQGEPAQALGPGDAVWIEAGEVHWHGAVEGRSFAHLAMQNANEAGVEVIWLEHVTDAEYAGAK